MHLSTVTINNVRKISNAELTLAPTNNVIVGPNGSGKTTFLEDLGSQLRQMTSVQYIDCSENVSAFNEYIWNITSNVLILDNIEKAIPKEEVIRLLVLLQGVCASWGTEISLYIGRFVVCKKATGDSLCRLHVVN